MEAILGLVLQYGVPQLLTAIQNWKTKTGTEPTVQEITALMAGVEPPTDYSKPVGAGSSSTK